jgi:uncharacterized membrane protein YraQ (UPF0718 family)
MNGDDILIIFTIMADWLTYTVLKLEQGSKITASVHFFIEDTVKIFTLLLFMIYIIAFLRAALDTEKVRKFLLGKKRGFAYFLGSLFGAVTPFCSCSSIPLFVGFTTAGIPLGTTMAFLITSPMINEVAIILLGSILGLKFMIIYIITGISAGILGGFFIDFIKAERYLTPIGNKALIKQRSGEEIDSDVNKITIKDRHEFALSELKEIFTRVAKWIVLGVFLGAVFHGFIPEDFISSHLGDKQWWSVPAAVLLGIPLYANASAIIPIAESLLIKGLPIGTTIAFMMSVVAASFPEFMMLKQVMKPKLLLIFFLLLLVLFTLSGWIFNLVY